MNPELRAFMENGRKRVDKALFGFLPPESDAPETLHRAMRYSVFAGGKRLRPILALAAFEAFDGADYEAAIRAACALECIHTYSLIHDDLPAMDNDDLRRGKPTSHKVFGEAIAILAGDALLNLAFEILCWPKADAATGRRLLLAASEIAFGAGSRGMVGGQCADVEAEGKTPTRERVGFIHTHKTARLIAASLASGAACADAGPDAVSRLRAAGLDLGLAFQITDDILDIEGTPESLGKSPGKDRAVQKATYPALAGMEESRRTREELLSKVQKDLDTLLGARAQTLKALSAQTVQRSS